MAHIIIVIIIITMIFNDDFERFFELAGVLYMKTRRIVTKLLEPAGITWDQFGTLAAMQHAAGLSQKQLAVALETDTTTAMVICEGLEKRGLITRTRNPDDRRTYRLAPTDKGRKCMARAMAIVGSAYAPWRAILSREEIASALPVLEKAAGHARAELKAMQERRR
jgi:DNA-binding MarR family transcriptional regulator